METRGVYLGWYFIQGPAILVGAKHYAVWVGYDCFEIETTSGGRKKDTHRIKHSYSTRTDRGEYVIEVAGSTTRTNQEIDEFNDYWIRRHPDYNAITINCQKYANDLIQFLTPGSHKQGLRQAQDDTWDHQGNSYEIHEHGIHEKRTTTGKAGFQAGIVGAGIEGPNAGGGLYYNFRSGNYGYMGEAALARAEVKVAAVGARLEPNLNTGVGLIEGNYVVKSLGFGLTAGANGIGIHTPLGSIGLGKF